MTKERNWGPAIGYYDLAQAIHTQSGASHNQLAVISLTESNHLSAIYHLYRALAVEEPHPNAIGNLEIEFRKIQEAVNCDKVANTKLTRDNECIGEALVRSFLRLHARSYQGIDTTNLEDDEHEVMRYLTLELKEKSLEGSLNKLILINIAAGHHAEVRLRGKSPEVCTYSSTC